MIDLEGRSKKYLLEKEIKFQFSQKMYHLKLIEKTLGEFRST